MMCIFVKTENMKNLLIASTSTLHGDNYLEYLLPDLQLHFAQCKSILFVPYARPGGISHEDYTLKVKSFFALLNIKVNGLHEFSNPTEAIEKADGIFTGGGNTFLLVTQLHQNNQMQTLKKAIESGTPYLGTSAGSNICGLTMQTTNDMPIIYPPSFETLGVIPFNLNPHYLDADLQSKHMGETRETRIKEFHQFNAQPVIGLREGSWLDVKGNQIVLKGALSARLFRQNQDTIEVESGNKMEKFV
jgi:dipeptidase E